MGYRKIDQIVTAQDASDGAGVRLRRSLGSQALGNLDPFLMLDEFRSDEPSDYLAGFPDHPHRGFETVTYMLAGTMQHADHLGNEGRLTAGAVQWMTAGKGIVHSEMPQQESGLLWGFQLWINLPARLKMTAPRYQDIPAEEVPVWTSDTGVRVKVIAGTSKGVAGPVGGISTAPIYLDVSVPRGSRFEQEIPEGHNGFCYVFEGEGEFGMGPSESGTPLGVGRLATLGDGDRVAVGAASADVRFLLLAAKPIGEPVARYGPFVMNTRAEIMQAVEDFQNGAFAVES
ncbi:MAG: quercetin 2,3-dioxygenase [Acidobacteria bacterium]|nr:quercetin 2,3-dioxygenase [Acidobacteriota bacterium]